MSTMPARSEPKTTRALQGAGRVVQVDDRLLGAAQRLEGALDQLVAGLGQHLDGDVVGDQVVLDQLRGRSRSRSGWPPGSRPRSPCSPCRTSSSNIRRLRSGVIGSISAWLPSRRSTAHQRGAAVVTVVRPGAVGQGDRGEGGVAVDRHPRGLLRIACVRVLLAFTDRAPLARAVLSSGGAVSRRRGRARRRNPRRGGRPRRGPRRGG